MRVLRDPVSGLSHGLGLVFALIGSGWLLAQARGAGMVTTYMIYAACLVALYAASTVYHLVPGSERIIKRLQLLDHAAIFLFVAGTSTPVSFHALAGGKRVLMLGLLWALAVAGVIITLLWRSAPRVLTTAMYVGMGWSVVLVWHMFVGGLLARPVRARPAVTRNLCVPPARPTSPRASVRRHVACERRGRCKSWPRARRAPMRASGATPSATSPATRLIARSPSWSRKVASGG